MRRLTEAQRRYLPVLQALDESGHGGFLPFASIQQATGLDRRTVRLGSRLLARCGLAEYGRGLWTEGGEPAGSGYAITDAGRAALEQNAEGLDG